MSDYQVCFILLIKSNQDKNKIKLKRQRNIPSNRQKKRVTLCLHKVILKITFPERKEVWTVTIKA